jgi:hypothetical protein
MTCGDTIVAQEGAQVKMDCSIDSTRNGIGRGHWFNPSVAHQRLNPVYKGRAGYMTLNYT